MAGTASLEISPHQSGSLIPVSLRHRLGLSGDWPGNFEFALKLLSRLKSVARRVIHRGQYLQLPDLARRKHAFQPRLVQLVEDH